MYKRQETLVIEQALELYAESFKKIILNTVQKHEVISRFFPMDQIDHQLKLQKREDIIPKIDSIVTKFPPRPKIDEDGMTTVEYSLPTVEK
jgi:hypothetical protein